MVAHTSVEELTSTRRKFVITIPQEQVQETCSRVVEDMQKEKEIRGFRKGKAPADIIRKFFKPDIAKESVSRLVDKAYREAIDQAGIQIVSEPHIEPVGSFEEDEAFVFSAVVDINPQFELQGYKDIVITLPASLRPLDLAQETEKVLQQTALDHGEKCTVERPVQANDILQLDYKIVRQDGTVYQDLHNQSLDLASVLPDFIQGVQGANVGESRSFPVTFPTPYHDASLAGQTVTFVATVHAIQERIPLPVDDALVKKYFNYNTLEEARNGLPQHIEKEQLRRRASAAHQPIVEQLLTLQHIDVAESLLEDTIDKIITNERDFRDKEELRKAVEDKSLREQYRGRALTYVQGTLALSQIARQENVKATSQDFTDQIQSVMGEFPTMDFSRVFQDRKFMQELSGMVLVRKVIEHLLGIITVHYA